MLLLHLTKWFLPTIDEQSLLEMIAQQLPLLGMAKVKLRVHRWEMGIENRR